MKDSKLVCQVISSSSIVDTGASSVCKPVKEAFYFSFKGDSGFVKLRFRLKI